MKKFKTLVMIEAESAEEVEEKLQAIQDLQDNLEHEDLLQAVDVVVGNPEIIEFIKEVAPEEGEELTLGDYLTIARKAYQKFG